MDPLTLPFPRQIITDKDKHITQREREMLHWLRQGKTSWEISKILQISENTVNFHIKNIMKKLAAVNRTHLVSIAFQGGLLGTKKTSKFIGGGG